MELDKCPKCGGRNLQTRPDGVYWIVECQDCGKSSRPGSTPRRGNFGGKSHA